MDLQNVKVFILVNQVIKYWQSLICWSVMKNEQ